MPPQNPSAPTGTSGTAPDASSLDLAQAFKDLARGEETARKMESDLGSLERKLDELLAGFEEGEERRIEEAGGTGGEGKREGKEEAQGKK